SAYRSIESSSRFATDTSVSLMPFLANASSPCEDHLRGVALHHRIVRYPARNHRGRRHDDVVADLRAVEHHGAGADPDSFADADALRNLRLLPNRDVEPIVAVVVADDRRQRADHRVVTDDDTARFGGDEAVRGDLHPVAEPQRPRGGFVVAEGGNDAALAEGDVRRELGLRARTDLRPPAQPINQRHDARRRCKPRENPGDVHCGAASPTTRDSAAKLSMATTCSIVSLMRSAVSTAVISCMCPKESQA